MLNIEQKKGDPSHLDGHVTVYAKIDIDSSEVITTNHPIASMIHNGLLVAQGNFKDQNNLRDFLKSEMGISLDEGLNEGLAQLLEKMDGLESALDPQKLRDRLENMDEIEDFIPTPAKIVPFHSEQEINSQEGDIFFAGVFKNIGNAVLSINAVPIVYQARYREQEIAKVHKEIEQLISQIESNELTIDIPNYRTAGASLEEKLLKEFIPNMLYCRKEDVVFEVSVKQFKTFMSGYRFNEDIESIISIIHKHDDLSKNDFKLLELYAKKITSVLAEDFTALEEIQHQIEELGSR